MPRWARLYFIIAACYTLTLGTLLVVNHLLLDAHDASIHTNTSWTHRQQRIDQLRGLAAAANTAGAQALEHGDVTIEAELLDDAHHDFVRQLQVIVTELQQHTSAAQQEQIVPALHFAGDQFDNAVVVVGELLELVTHSAGAAAQQQQVISEAALYLCLDALDRVTATIQELQLQRFDAQRAGAQTLGLLNLWVQVGALLLLLLVGAYGLRMSRALGRQETHSALQLAALKERERELMDAREDAEAANQAKSAFLANMSHELRTPMTAIMGYAEVLRETEAGEEAQAAIGTIERNSQHLLTLLNDILDLSKVEAGRMEVEAIDCDPTALVAEVMELMAAPARAKGLMLEALFAGRIPDQITSDPTRIRQVLVNLVGNAIKFTESGTIRIVTSLQLREGGSEKQLCFSVSDEGKGIDPEQAARLFQPFEQADTSTTRKHGGTGLGLSISKRFTEMLGGDLIPFCELDKGCVFHAIFATGDLGVRAMRSVEDYDLDSIPSARLFAQRQAAGERDQLAGARVLLAEDGVDNQRLIQHILGRAGATVEVANHGREALDHLAAGEAFDLILMDMQMPVMGGVEATRRLREQGDQTPVIALTAAAMQEDRESFERAGCNAFETKPINRVNLLTTLRHWLEVSRGASAPAGARAD